MKKKATVLIASIMAFCGINTAHADEGMWTIYNLPNAVYEMMQREGFSMTYDQLYNGENALKNAVVNFSGYCSGVVVSPDGLVFTNHHCGFEASDSLETAMVVGKDQSVWRNDYARAIAREINYGILQGVLAIVELVVSHTEAFALHHLVHCVWQVVNCPHTLVSVSGIDSAERHDRGDKDRCFFLHFILCVVIM